MRTPQIFDISGLCAYPTLTIPFLFKALRGLYRDTKDKNYCHLINYNQKNTRTRRAFLFGERGVTNPTHD